MHFMTSSIFGLAIQTALYAILSQGADNPLRPVPDAPLLELPRSHTDLRDFREYLDSYPKTKGNPELYRAYGECLAGVRAGIDWPL